MVIELTNERRALERVLLHFAHFEKKAEKLDETHYRVIVYYDRKDENGDGNTNSLVWSNGSSSRAESFCRTDEKTSDAAKRIYKLKVRNFFSVIILFF